MARTFKHTQWNENIVQVSWDLGNSCNQDCSYCPPVIKNGNFSNGSWETVEKFADRLCDHYERLNKLAIIGFGGSGEPTLVSWFPNLLRAINNRVAGCHVSTNLTAPLEWWEENGNMITRVNGSIHYEYTTLRESYDLIHQVRDRTRSMNIAVPMIPDRFDEQMEDIDWFRSSSDISILPQVVFANMVTSGKWKKEYTDEKKTVLKTEHDKQTYTITTDTKEGKKVEALSQIEVHLNENDNERVFTGWECYAGIDTLVIDSRGFVRRGWCAQLSMEQKHMNEWHWNDDPITCNMMWCRQQHDLFAMKRVN